MNSVANTGGVRVPTPMEDIGQLVMVAVAKEYDDSVETILKRQAVDSGKKLALMAYIMKNDWKLKVELIALKLRCSTGDVNTLCVRLHEVLMQDEELAMHGLSIRDRIVEARAVTNGAARGDLPKGLSPPAERILQVILSKSGLPMGVLREKSKIRERTRARGIAYLLLSEHAGVKAAQIAAIFDRTEKDVWTGRERLKVVWREQPRDSQCKLLREVCMELRIDLASLKLDNVEQ
ncbi:hypothetical protein A2853_02085 [Candidatus Kaiserbacteria bacterium RIFCSPHIGHO2_01_FULL_55_17]|uniref:Uncharacterized protein n=1 Tax=Candidatus Kaiserbacteria bacterium RIFCSPHIGHO2_01_FULL_55_17 TaxID=1798484 RepID=A0A1F6DAM5_9BACT|nr:MAG: hypothetical protein A2853_02085 [Candidatus Kaiserbacteria bacterium RIFCSPHIGHO2_01_FULL_55_17]